MYCKSCGESLNENQVVCVKCGVKVGDGNAYCANCGNEVALDAEFCINCGVAVKKKVESDLNGQDKLVMILICLFLGGIGIHNFMMGETKKGIFKIIMSFCFGISWIFAIIDLIKLAMGTYEVNADKFI